MTDFSKDQAYVEWFFRNQKAIEKAKDRGGEGEKPASSQNFSF